MKTIRLVFDDIDENLRMDLVYDDAFEVSMH